MTPDNFKKLILHTKYESTIKEIRNIEFSLGLKPSELKVDMQNYYFPPNGTLVGAVEKESKYCLNLKEGEEFLKSGQSVFAYDESIVKFMGLEGSAYLTSHSIVFLDISEYLPCNLLTLYFYTKSLELSLRPEFNATKWQARIE
jgi:hypothetical protein